MNVHIGETKNGVVRETCLSAHVIRASDLSEQRNLIINIIAAALQLSWRQTLSHAPFLSWYKVSLKSGISQELSDSEFPGRHSSSENPSSLRRSISLSEFQEDGLNRSGLLRVNAWRYLTVSSVASWENRTGLLTASLLMALSIEDEAITHDYSLTTVGLERAILMFEEQFTRFRGENWQEVLNMAGSKYHRSIVHFDPAESFHRRKTMAAVLPMMREKHGGAESYLKTHTSLTDQYIQKLRDNFIQSHWGQR
ncbi:hypothetical protein C8J56DRAFT_886783 [Mycena floridula]|nr:hypothetical protein C8J56DRAFT_886783 [Mycena floridula]